MVEVQSRINGMTKNGLGHSLATQIYFVARLAVRSPALAALDPGAAS
jgi:hypothetical protein